MSKTLFWDVTFWRILSFKKEGPTVLKAGGVGPGRGRTDANPTVDFFVNALNGWIKVEVVPAPEASALALLGSGWVGLFWLR